MEPKALPDKLVTDRVTLKKPDASYAGPLLKKIHDDRERLQHFFHWANNIKKEEDLQNAIDNLCKEWSELKSFNYYIYTNNNQDVIGHIGVIKIDWPNRRAELSFWLFTAYQGKGYMNEAIQNVEKALFETGIHRIEIKVETNNRAAIKAAEKAFYIQESIIRQDWFINNTFYDRYMYSKLSTEQKIG